MELTDYTKFEYHPISEQLVSVLRKMNQNTESDNYFRVLSSFYLAQVASTMRAVVSTEDRGVIPINLYAFLTAASGFGKTKSVNIFERELLGQFYVNFLETTLPELSYKNMEAEAIHICQRNGSDFDEELSKLQTEYDSLGAYVFSFPEGSGPAYRQVRAKCQLSGVGSTNFISDEFGYNLLKSTELLDIHFEVYDIGVIKDKITKSSSENKRYVQRTCPVPANLLAFGTPEKLFDGSVTEVELTGRFESGYGRRFIYAEGVIGEDESMTPEELYDRLVNGAKSADLNQLKHLFGNLADSVNAHKVIPIERAEGILLTRYKMECEFLAKSIPPHKGTLKAELQHRYFRAMKLAGSYAFTDSTPNVTNAQLMAAIRVVEDSGEAFKSITSRPKPYVRLAEYIANVGEELTHSDIIEGLPFYPSAKNKQEEMLSLATSWGHKNNIIIKRSFMDNIEFFKGESLQENKLDKLIVSYSTHDAYNYLNQELRWEQVGKLCQTPDYHWVNHHLNDGHRKDDNIIAGSNMFVIDIDGGLTLQSAKTLMEGIACYVYVTKSHTNAKHRFRIVVPLKYTMKLSKADYKEFMNNVYESLPFPVEDDCGNQRSKKWLCNKAAGQYLEGELFDPIPFIPKTKKNKDRQEENKKLGNMDKVERFFAKRWSSGRNNTLLDYGMMLMDSGSDLYDAQQKILAFNKTFSDPVSEDELNNTIFIGMSKKVL